MFCKIIIYNLLFSIIYNLFCIPASGSYSGSYGSSSSIPSSSSLSSKHISERAPSSPLKYLTIFLDDLLAILSCVGSVHRLQNEAPTQTGAGAIVISAILDGEVPDYYSYCITLIVLNLSLIIK